jgi:hypothetical protein
MSGAELRSCRRSRIASVIAMTTCGEGLLEVHRLEHAENDHAFHTFLRAYGEPT